MTSPKTSAIFGLMMVLIYNFLDAGKEVYAGFLVQKSGPMLVTLIDFATVLVFFQCLCLQKSRLAYVMPWQHPGVTVLLNLATAGAWITFFYCVRYLEPAIASAIITGIAPLIIVILSPFLYLKEKRQYRLSFLIGIAACSCWLSFISSQQVSANHPYSRYEILAGILLAIMCAVFSIFCNILSKKLSNRQCTPEAIMAHRFYLTILITFGYSYALQVEYATGAKLFPGVFFLAILGVIFPLWCLQYAIKHLTPAKTMIFMAITPVFTYMFQLFDPRLSPTYLSLAAITSLCFFSLATEIWKIRLRPDPLPNG